MITKRRIQAVALCPLVIAVIVLFNSRKANWKKEIWDRHNELTQEYKTGAGVIQAQMLPAAIFYRDDANPGSKYVLRIKLKVNQPIQQKRLMQYMNFGIGKYFFALQGRDTLQQTVFEKIPGIDRNEFVYMTCFDRPLTANNGNLLICITDTAAGFGNSSFEFKNKIVQKLRQ